MNIIPYHYVFVGSGLSCTYTLIHLLNILKHSAGKKLCNVLVLEKAEEFWTGIPYGNRSGKSSLIITALKDFIPVSERELFINFLNRNLTILFDDFESKGGKLSLEWRAENKTLVETEKWDDIFLPRYFFGEFLKNRISDLINEASELGLVKFDLIQAEVKEIRKEKEKYIISYCNNEEEIIIESEKVILSVGSPPKKPFLNVGTTGSKFLLIEDLYQPAISANISLLVSSLCRTSVANNVLVIGSNASALELFYNLNNFPELRKSVNKYYVISPSKFPHPILIGTELENYDLSNLELLKTRKRFTANDILEAVKKDTYNAENAGVSIAGIINSTSSVIIDLLNRLSFTQQKQFVHAAGVEIGKLQRRAGHEYLAVVQNLLERDKLELIQGKFSKATEVKEGLQFEYIDKEGQSIAFSTPVQAIINCGGFNDISENTISLLIKNLIKNNICKPNRSRRGFFVNERFEANKNLFVMGPLLAGNINKNIRVWHAESCSRIFSLSKQLAENLAADH